MSDVDVPHFDLPFRLGPGGRFAVVEQNTYDDIFNCVHMAFRYFQGQRVMVPTFGIPDLTFDPQPLDTKYLIAEVENHEPRAQEIMSQETDDLIARVTAEVRQNNA